MASFGAVAVVGMACRLPGGIDSPERLWDALLRGDDLVTEIPPERWNADEYYDPEPGVPGRSVCKWGAFLDDVAGFDCEFFGISEQEAVALDPQHRLLLETSWEAMEYAGLTPATVTDSRTGVFVGLTHSDYQLVAADSPAVEGPFGFQGNTFSMASGRIAYALGVHGPAVTVDSACSSGLLAVHMACRSLNDGESDLALAGGAFVMLEPRKFAAGSAQGMLSSTGRCHAFDAAADGYVPGEACVAVLLKRLPDALRSGDRILAVVRGTAANQDGHTVDIATPSPTAQIAVYRAALAAAGVDADSIGMHFSKLPEEFSRLTTKLFVPQEVTLWPDSSQQPRRAAVSAYGLSGTNVHAVLEQAPEVIAPQRITGQSPVAKPLLFGLSATSADGLRHTAGRLADWVQEHQRLALPDLAYTLACRRAHRPVRTGVIASSRPELVAALRAVTNGDNAFHAALGGDDRGPVWVFSGPGSQWARMGAELLATEPVFAATVAQIEPLIVVESGFWVVDAMTAPQVVTDIDRVHPTLFTMQVALAATMTAYGVRPGAIIGHSLGEVAAAVVAGALSLADGVRVICRQSQLMARLAATSADTGTMASVELPALRVRSELTARGIYDVVLASVAAPNTTVISGAAQPIRDLVADWQQREIPAREIDVEIAAQSPQVDPILDGLADALADLNPTAPEIPYYSATLFDPCERPVCDANYWIDNLRHTVRFAAAVQVALEDGYRVFAELGPHPLLTDAVEQTAHRLDIQVAALGSMRREQALPYGLRGLLGELHSAGVAVDFSVQHPGGRLVDAPLPTWTRRQLLLSRDDQGTLTHGA